MFILNFTHYHCHLPCVLPIRNMSYITVTRPFVHICAKPTCLQICHGSFTVKSQIDGSNPISNGGERNKIHDLFLLSTIFYIFYIGVSDSMGILMFAQFFRGTRWSRVHHETFSEECHESTVEHDGVRYVCYFTETSYGSISAALKQNRCTWDPMAWEFMGEQNWRWDTSNLPWKGPKHS